ncbi:glycoside hydrolase family 38 amine-terminal domain protein (macronuclear) [Tetrahymena thermophila SB210]|uniref:Glycoside hydrolase family 38 amine-terminal domain protein n=1 Tax=Tetrahymena thermophila (strain SB210) TaxID=312017 RepID=Q241T5_TETTS|nr:glycoside hydrolase family 38 amine-terminal domain protein [Tetrahymena thermophila SB210]EAS02485.2 glycoside hydrolase family 38 amine-terminal domain protein [Tetrahymena thermophila SB210]|eukprot:XP_001022730.2 glycoside hydrolase family 38 amine-terminal domain protein [Tetrahymena thermophila SB210]
MLILFVLIHLIKCQVDNITYVHLIPHSHDDYGWLYTIDEYYSNRIIQFGQEYGNVRDILNSVYSEIQKNNERKYIQVEIGFLDMWWKNQNEEVRNKYKELVQSGKIEIINGGWTMHDEATTYFEDIIDQMTVGHQWVKENLGVVPEIGWQIDPFGHQQTNAALFSQMGFNAQWFARVDYQDFDYRKQNKRLEMVWHPKEYDEDAYIFSAINYQHYSPPRNFFFERGQQVTQSNVHQKAREFVNYFQQMRQSFQTNHLIHTMGEDFTFSHSEVWFDSIDLLIEYINKRRDEFGMVIQYSTPSQYLKEINKQQKKWPVNNHDFYPYADTQNAYWTGYFTSRPSLKGLTKDSGRYLQAIRNIFSFEHISRRTQHFESYSDKIQQSLQYFEEQMAALMHHDAVSGTGKQRVVNDYIYRISNGYSKIRDYLNPLLREYTLQDISESDVSYQQCNWNATASQCNITFSQINAKKPVLVNIYNPSVTRIINIRIRVPDANITVINQKNQLLQADLICSHPQNQKDCDLYFKDQFEGYSFQYYKIIFQDSKYQQKVQPMDIKSLQEQVVIELSKLSTLKVDLIKQSFLYQVWETEKQSSFEVQKLKEYTFSLQYNFYYSSQNWGQSSGAYIFRPDNDQTYTYSQIKNITIYRGQLVTIVLLQGEHTTTQLRFYFNNFDKIVEVETFIHPINVSDGKGKEVVMIVNTNLKNKKTFYTDSNGLSLQKRILNFRPTWDLRVHQEVSGNYYPIGSMIQIQDEDTNQQISVVNDRSQGGTSLKEGQLELMIHRRTLQDDNRGVGESLNEIDIESGQNGLSQKIRHYIVFESQNGQLSRRVQNELDASPLIFFAESDKGLFNFKVDKNLNKIIKNSNIYLRVYLKIYQGHYTLRLYNVNDNQEANFEIPSNFQIMEELTLTANQSKQDWYQKQMKWQGENGKTYQQKQNDFKKEIEQKNIKLKPLQLRVFKVDIKKQR